MKIWDEWITALQELDDIDAFTGILEFYAETMTKISESIEKKKEIKYEYTKLFNWMWWNPTEEIVIVELMHYTGLSYNEIINTPYEIIETLKIRMSLEAKQAKNGK